MIFLNLAHKIRLVPTSEQEQYFRKACGVSRLVYNYALEEWKRQYAEGLKPNGRDLLKQFNKVKYEKYPFLKDVHRDCNSRPFVNLQQAFVNMFNGSSGYPIFKKRGQHDSFYLANDQFIIEENTIRMPRIGWIKMRENLRFVGKIMSATVSREADQWYVSITVEMKDENVVKERVSNNSVGIDLGVKDFAVLSTGEKIEGPKPFKKLQKQISRKQRQLSKKKLHSSNWYKCKEELSRLYLRVKNIRKDFLHKLSTKLCRENQAISIEDLGTAGMVKLHSLAKAILDMGWGEFRRQLTYKSKIYNNDLLVVDRFFPSSKLCSDCGYKLKELKLEQREWVCPKCGVVHDRDENAAINLLNQLGQVMPEVTPVDMTNVVNETGISLWTCKNA